MNLKMIYNYTNFKIHQHIIKCPTLKLTASKYFFATVMNLELGSWPIFNPKSAVAIAFIVNCPAYLKQNVLI